jgi:hypothetical protein
MKASSDIECDKDARFPDECYVILLKYLDLGDIMKTMVVLNKSLRELILSENYIIFKHFIRHFNLHQRLKRADIPAKIDILQLIKDNSLINTT